MQLTHYSKVCGLSHRTRWIVFTCNSQHADGSIPPKGETVVRTTEPNIGMFVLMLIYLSISIISTDMIFLTILISVRLFVCLFVCFLVLVCFLSVFCFVFVSGFNVFPTVNFEKRFDVFVQKPYCVQDTIHHLKTFSFHCSSSDFFFGGGAVSFNTALMIEGLNVPSIPSSSFTGVQLE